MLSINTLPPDLYSRNLKTAQILASWVNLLRMDRIALLDVGGAFGSLKSFLPKDWGHTVADLRIDASLRCVRADAEHLPFNSNSFDFVVSHDFLEHVPNDSRIPSIEQMMRVARHGVILAGPLENGLNSFAERKVNDFFLRHSGEEHPYLKDHVRNGLPSLGPIAKHLGTREVRFSVELSDPLFEWVILQLFASYWSIYGIRAKSLHQAYTQINQLTPANVNAFYRTHVLISKSQTLPLTSAVAPQPVRMEDFVPFCETAFHIFDALADSYRASLEGKVTGRLRKWKRRLFKSG